MAKVKIEEKEITTTPTPIKYKGNVTIKLVKDNKVIKSIKRHNAGCPALWDFLTKCLASVQNWNSCPKWLRCFYKEGGSPTQANLGNSVFVHNSAVNCQSADQNINSGEYSTVYKFIIPSSIINPSYSEINCIALFSSINKNNLQQPSAFLELTGNDIIDISNLSVGVSILILWELSFANDTN